jgi:hypothetical protein
MVATAELLLRNIGSDDATAGPIEEAYSSYVKDAETELRSDSAQLELARSH